MTADFTLGQTVPPGDSAFAEKVAELLGTGKASSRRLAVRLLGTRAVPGKLDDLWRIHCHMQADPKEYVTASGMGRNVSVSPLVLYEESFAALRAAVQLEPAWLTATALSAAPGDPCVADLAYLVANLDDGGDVWRACKADLFRIVGDDKRRALATNIGIWRDAVEADRLVGWAKADHGDDGDRLGPAAVRAMAQIDPVEAVPLLAGLPEHELYLTRSWTLPMLFRSDGDAVCDVLFDRIRSADDPLRAALVYQGSEADVDARTLDLLLDEMAATLGKRLGQSPDSAAGLFVPLELLVKMGRADLLPVFEARRGTALEHRLADLLIDLGGPRQSLYSDFLPREPGIELLLRIGGDGYGRVTRAYLAADSQYGRLDAVQYAVRSADEATLAAVAAVGTDPAYWDEEGTPLVQIVAARTLAAHGDLGRLLDVMWFLGPSIPEDLGEWLPSDVTVPADVAGRAMEAIRQRDRQRLPGSLLLPGYVGDSRAAADAMAVLNDESADRPATVAAAVCLGRLGVAEAVGPIAAHLSDGRRWAVAALQRIGTGDAVAQLLRNLGRTWDAGLAVWLAGRPDVSAAAAQLIADRAGSATWPDALAALVATADENLLTAVMGRLEPHAVDGLRAAAFKAVGAVRVSGRRRDAIRCLAVVDPAAAVAAATRALADPADPDRPLYPPVLYGLDPSAARAAFVRAAADAGDKNHELAWSLSYALQADTDADWLAALIRSGSADQRRAACRLAVGPCGAATAVADALANAAGQPSDRLNRIAEQAINHAAAQRMAGQLAAAVMTVDTPARAASLAAAALAVGRRGPKDGVEPGWFALLVRQLRGRGQRGLALDVIRLFRFGRGKG